MEKWQKDHIVERQPQLLETIIVTQQLLAVLKALQIFGGEDVDQIECKENNYARRKHLLDIVKTRSNGYECLAYALSECKQNGAFEILMEGYILNVTPGFKIQWGKEDEKPISSILDKPTISRICQKVNNSASSEYLKLYEHAGSRKEVSELLRATIPPIAEHYIPRSLSKRVFLKDKIFKVDCPDTFVFTGILAEQLGKFITHNKIANSTTQLFGIDKRFIVLDCDADWEELGKLANVPIHLVRYQAHEGERFMVESTSGGSNVIQKYLYATEYNIITEDELIEEVLKTNGTGISICDVPGMGKSLLLASIANKLAMRCPESLVAFIRLSTFMEQVEKVESPSTTDVAMAAKAISRYLSTPSLSQLNLQEMLTDGSNRVDLFFDGFDEISPRKFDLSRKLLQEVDKNFPNTRIYVTSRTHTRQELETSLKVISHDILPFTQENQLQFLTSFWERNDDQGCEEKRTEFALFCLKKLKENLNKTESEITGIPLQCRLVAEVFLRNSILYSNPQRYVPIEELCRFEGTFAHVYKQYMVIRFSHFTKVRSDRFLGNRLMKLVGNFSPSMPMSLSISEMEKLKQFHFYKALNTLFPEFSSSFSSAFKNISSNCSPDAVFGIGLLEGGHDWDYETVEFLHRTFAEYLAADGFVMLLNGSFLFPKKTRMSLFKMFFSGALRAEYSRFFQPVFVHFLNFTLGETTSISCPQDTVLAFSSSVSAAELYMLLQALIRSRYTNLLKLVKQLFSGVEKTKRTFYQQFFFEDSYKCLAEIAQYAIWYSCPITVTELFTDFFGLNLLDVYNIVEQHSECPLKLAVKGVNEEMVEFLIDKIPLNSKSLARSCFHHSYSDSQSKIKKRIRIFNLLLTKYNDLVQEDSELLSKITGRMNLECIKVLLRNGANPYAADDNKETVVHYAASYMSQDHLHEICRFLIEDCQAVDLFSEKVGKWSSPVKLFCSKASLSTIEMVTSALKTKLSSITNLK